MPKKKGKKVMTLSDFQGEGTGNYNDLNALPSGPSGYNSRPDERGGGRYGDRGGGGRYGDRAESGFRSHREESRSDGDWGRRGAGGGGGGFGDDDSSRADDAGDWRSVRSGGRTGGFRRDDRDRDYGMGGSSGYKRLNLSKRGEVGSGDVRSRSTVSNRKNVDEPKQPAAERKFALDDVDTVEAENKQSALDKAIELGSEVDVDELAAGLENFTLTEDDKFLVDCIAKSVVTGKLSLTDMVATLQNARSEEEAASLLCRILMSIQHKQGEIKFVHLVRERAEDLCGIIAKGKKDADLDTFLESKNLICLKPIPDLSSIVDEAKAPDDILAALAKSVPAKLSCSEVTPMVAKAVCAKLFADKANPNLTVLADYAPLLLRVLTKPMDDFEAQMNFLFSLQQAWFDAGKPKGVIKKVFTGVYDEGVCAVEAYNMWKDNTKNKSKGKVPALLQTNSWIEEIQPEEEEEGEGDEGDEEEEEDYVPETQTYF